MNEQTPPERPQICREFGTPHVCGLVNPMRAPQSVLEIAFGMALHAGGKGGSI